MKQVRIFTISSSVVMIALLLLSACRNTSSVSFYTLNGQISRQSSEKALPKMEDLSVGIGSVQLPDYLDRPQIVTLKGVSRLHLAEFHRWAGRLDGEIVRVMMTNLSMRLGTSRIIDFPWNRSEIPQFRLDLTFHHFEGILAENVRIKGIWRLSQNTPEPSVLHQQFDLSVPVEGPEYEDLVLACNQGLWELSENISTVIRGKAAVSTHR